MNQMGHNLPNLMGVDTKGLDQKFNRVLPDYMTMGESGMGGHSEHMQHMELPRNSIPMLGANARYGYIDMGGMFTVLKVRDGITSYDDPGWYENPDETLASPANADEMNRDGITNKLSEGRGKS